jgi:hypothetical protein
MLGREPPVDFLKYAHLHRNYIKSPQGRIYRRGIVTPLLLKDSENFIVGGHHARHEFCNVLGVKILEVNLDVRFEVEKLFIVILGQLGRVKVLE